MNSFLRRSTAGVLAISAGLASVVAPLTTTVASRIGIAAATSAVALAVPMSAHAQSGKRICGTVFGLRLNQSGSGKAGFMMEVSKYDPVTCTALLATWVTITGLPNSLQSYAQGLLNIQAGVGTGIVGNLRAMQTCEAFSSSVGANTGDVCLQMQDYKIYKFVSAAGIYSQSKL